MRDMGRACDGPGHRGKGRGVQEGRHGRSAHRWRVLSAKVRKSPAYRYATLSASAATTTGLSAPQHVALAMSTFATWSPV